MKILQLISSPRGEASVSIKLSKAIVEKLQAANPGSTLKVRDLTSTPVPTFGRSAFELIFYATRKQKSGIGRSR